MLLYRPHTIWASNFTCVFSKTAFANEVIQLEIRQIWKLVSRRRPAFYGWFYVVLIPGFAVVFWLLQGFGASELSPLEALYFSAVTITTLGYGDIQPLDTVVRLLAASEAVLGIVTIGFFLSALAQQRSDETAEEQLAWLSGGDSVPCLGTTSTGYILTRHRGTHPIYDLHVQLQEYWWPLEGEELPAEFWNICPAPRGLPMLLTPYRTLSVHDEPVLLPNRMPYYPDKFQFNPSDMLFPETGKFYLRANFRARNGTFRQFIAGKVEMRNGQQVLEQSVLLLGDDGTVLVGDDRWVKAETFIFDDTEYNSDDYIRRW